MKRLRDRFTARSWARYLLWRATGMRGPVRVELTSGEVLLLRAPPARDLWAAHEIFVASAYEPPALLPELAPELIVDLGANVGYSVVLLAHRFPRARLLAFEPHPEHLLQLYDHVLANKLERRVEIVGSAVSGSAGRAHLSSDQDESRIVENDAGTTLPVRVRDLFEELGGARVDFLKMDIEGGEFEILRDPRFADLDVRALVLEWHNTDKTPDGKSWCRQRLTDLGYGVMEGALDYGRAGVLWAWRPAAG